ncbi:MAG: DUF5654 family protein [bacterium]|nr:DUF5654 family protein [bacterium]
MNTSIKTQNETVKNEVQEKIVTYMGAAFGFVAGLAWNDAVKALIDTLFPLSKDGLIAKFIYAILVTVVVVVVTIYLQRILRKRVVSETKS